jgi:DNA-binding NarL/FixJ family response regulator
MTHRIRILLVDDHPFVREGVRARLQATEHLQVVAEAAGTDEALALAPQVQPDLVVTDIRMPQGNGIHLTAEFRDRFPLVRVLVLSMHEDPEYVRRAVALGARGYVLKSAPAQYLIDAIDTVYQGGTYFSADLIALLHDVPPPQRSAKALTPREASVLQWVAQGRSNKEIAALLGTSVRTVETHRLHLRRKLRIDGQAALVKFAVDYADIAQSPPPHSGWSVSPGH